MKPERNWIPIDDLIRDARERAHAQLAGKPVFFLVENELPGCSLLADPFILRGALRTLIANAAKQTDLGKLKLRITRDSYAVRFSVEDTGRGMSPGAQREALRPRPVIDANLVHRLGDTDLGLPLSRHLVGLLGGELSAVSSPAAGSVFTITLPAVDGLGNEMVRRLDASLWQEGRRTIAA
jgi:signal transduction histidine kinase